MDSNLFYSKTVTDVDPNRSYEYYKTSSVEWTVDKDSTPDSYEFAHRVLQEQSSILPSTKDFYNNPHYYTFRTSSTPYLQSKDYELQNKIDRISSHLKLENIHPKSLSILHIYQPYSRVIAPPHEVLKEVRFDESVHYHSLETKGLRFTEDDLSLYTVREQKPFFYGNENY